MALKNRRDGNREAIEAFANQFDPPLPVVKTRAVGGIAVTNGWQAALHDEQTELGITAVIWGGGHMKIFLEVQTTAAEAESFGVFFRDVMLEAVVEGEEEHEPATQQDQAGVPDLARGVTDETYTEENSRTREPAGLLSDRMETGRTETAQERDRREYGYPVKLGEESPNPGFIDMTELHQAEQLALVNLYPELKFRMGPGGQRFRLYGGDEWRPDDGAGFCSAKQLAAMRAIAGQGKMLESNAVMRRLVAPRRRLPAAVGIGGTVAAAAPADDDEPETPKQMGARPKDGCSHEWVRNSIGGGSTCRKCGGFEAAPSTRSRQAAINAERRLRDMVDAEAKCLAERGTHSLVVTVEDGQRVGVCQFCGVTVPEEDLPVLEAPVASGEGQAEPGQG